MLKNKQDAQDIIDILLSDVMQREDFCIESACEALSSAVFALQHGGGTMLLPIGETILKAVAKEHGWQFICDVLSELEGVWE